MTLRRRSALIVPLALAVGVFPWLGGSMARSQARSRTIPPYASLVLAAHPVGYWRFEDASASTRMHASAGGVDGAYRLRPDVVRGVVGKARKFDGISSFASIPSRPGWSQTTTGRLSIEFWLRPSRVVFADEEGSGYVWVVAKGTQGHQEWGVRMYGRDNTESPPRENRVALYAYNPAGGQGAGAYFQKTVRAGDWIYVVGELTPTGVSIWRNAVFVQGPPAPGAVYANPKYDIVPRSGPAPLTFGTRDGASFFAGSLDEVAVYPYLLSSAQMRRHYRAGLAALAAKP